LDPRQEIEGTRYYYYFCNIINKAGGKWAFKKKLQKILLQKNKIYGECFENFIETP